MKVERNQCEKRYLLVVSAYAQTDCRLTVIDGKFLHQQTVLPQKMCSTDNVVLARYLNVQVERLGTAESHRGGLLVGGQVAVTTCCNFAQTTNYFWPAPTTGAVPLVRCSSDTDQIFLPYMARGD